MFFLQGISGTEQYPLFPLRAGHAYFPLPASGLLSIMALFRSPPLGQPPQSSTGAMAISLHMVTRTSSPTGKSDLALRHSSPRVPDHPWHPPSQTLWELVTAKEEQNQAYRNYTSFSSALVGGRSMAVYYITHNLHIFTYNLSGVANSF